MPLTDSKIRTAKTLEKSYKITDSQGPYLTIAASGSRLWYFRYRLDGKESRLSLGTYPHVTLTEARERRDAARKLLSAGINPSQQRKSEKICNKHTFKELAISWHTCNLKLWSERHANKILT